MITTNGVATPHANGSTALATRTTEPQAIDARTDRAAFEPASLAQAYELATKLVKSGLMPRALNSPEAVVTAVIMGRELGLTAMQSVRSIHVIEGKPALSSALIVALVKKSPVCKYFRMVESTDEVAKYETLRDGDPEPTRMAFTMAQAKQAGVTGKDNWRKFPAAMLRARCETALARAVYPDLVMGLYDPDELERSEPQRAEPQRAEPRDVTPPAAPVVVPVAAPEPEPVLDTTAQETTPGAREQLATLIENAETGADLKLIRTLAKDAKASGALSGDDYKAALAAYTAKADELAKKGVR